METWREGEGMRFKLEERRREMGSESGDEGQWGESGE